MEQQQHYLPPNNISEQLFRKDLEHCIPPLHDKNFKPAPCCTDDKMLREWFIKNPIERWDDKRNSMFGQGFDLCLEDAFFKQCMMSQKFNYMSGNNKLK